MAENGTRAMLGEVLQRSAPCSHHALLLNSPSIAAPLTCSRLPVPLTTPWQVLRANPFTYAGRKWRNLYLLFELQSKLPRGIGWDQSVRSAGSSAVRNEGRRTLLRGPIEPCRSAFHHTSACLACSHSFRVIMVDISSSWNRIIHRYEQRGSISGKRVAQKVACK